MLIACLHFGCAITEQKKSDLRSEPSLESLFAVKQVLMHFMHVNELYRVSLH